MQVVGVTVGAVAPTSPKELAMSGTTILAVDLGKYKCVA
jgi:hypothetical protein